MSLVLGVVAASAPFAKEVLSLLIGAAVRGGAVLLLAAAVVRLWPRTSATQRHLVWTVACCGLLLLPVLQSVVPELGIRILPAVTVPSTVITRNPSPRAVPEWSRVTGRVGVVPRGNASIGNASTTGVVGDAPLAAFWTVLALVVWGGGALVVLLSLLHGQWQARRYVSAARPLTDARVLVVLDTAGNTLRLTRRVSVRCHPAAMPMVAGVLRPVIVLPADVHEWGEARVRHVLLHELAHVKRHDNLVQTAVSLACALYWFNPLVWMAARALRTERERACDDHVLAAAECHPSDYAMDLLELAQAFRPMSGPALATLAFVRAPQIHTRLQAIMDEAQRRTRMSRWGTVLVWGAGLGVVCPLGGVMLRPMAPEGRVVRRGYPGSVVSRPFTPPVVTTAVRRAGVPQHGRAPPSSSRRAGRRTSAESADMDSRSTHTSNHTEDHNMKKSAYTTIVASAAAGLLAGAPAVSYGQGFGGFISASPAPGQSGSQSNPSLTGSMSIGSDSVSLSTAGAEHELLLLNQDAGNSHLVVVLNGARINETDLADLAKSLQSGKVHIKQGGIQEIKGDAQEAAKYGAGADDRVILISTEPDDHKKP